LNRFSHCELTASGQLDPEYLPLQIRGILFESLTSRFNDLAAIAIVGVVHVLIHISPHRWTPVPIAPLFVLVDTVLGAGIWFLQSWARIIILIDLTWLFGRAAVGLMALVVVHPKVVHFQSSSPYFAINVLVSLMMLSCLLDPDIEHAFQRRA
jgi:membrane protease YdiL (CAAX protease family)